jgi:hypothetical protein
MLIDSIVVLSWFFNPKMNHPALLPVQLHSPNSTPLVRPIEITLNTTNTIVGVNRSQYLTIICIELKDVFNDVGEVIDEDDE